MGSDPEHLRGVIVKNNGTEFVGIMEVHGVNFNLLSSVEQNILEDNFAQLLNGIDYPFQIHVQSKKLDIERYYKNYQSRLDQMSERIDSIQKKINVLSSKPGQEAEIKELEDKIYRMAEHYKYGLGLLEYIKYRCEGKEMIEKKYYFVVSTTHKGSEFKEKLTDDEKLQNAYFDLENRISTIIAGLRNSELSGHFLSPIEVAEVLYRSYNKKDSEHYKLSNALEKGFSSNFVQVNEHDELKIKKKIKELELEIELESQKEAV